MTKHGFFSMVQKAPGVYHVRSRERRDLQNLVARVPLPGVRILESRRTDYRFRVVVDQAAVSAIMRFLGGTVDYSNFKAEIDRTPDQARKPYHEVWAVMAMALGAYGRPGGFIADMGPIEYKGGTDKDELRKTRQTGLFRDQ